MSVVIRVLVPLLVLAGLVPAGAPAAAAGRCSAGLVALTFDDGPSPTVTPRLVGILDRLGVPATFFMVGERVAAAPRTARLVAAHGYAVANHSYRHRMMTTQSSADVRSTLLATDRELRAAGVRPTRLMRPPYGAMDGRVEAVIRDAGFVPVLWDVDPRDWERRSSGDIAARILAHLRPGRSNVVLQHDGIGNSPNSVDAVPIVVREARARGYCFAGLGANGRMAPPVPVATVRAGTVDEGEAVRVRIRLDRPTSRRTSVLLRTVAGTASAGADFEFRRLRVYLPVGSTRAVVRVPTLRDGLDETRERFGIRLSRPRGMRLGQHSARASVRDLDPRPAVSVLDASVLEPVEGTTTVPVTVELARRSGLRVRVDLTTATGTAGTDDYVERTATLFIPAGKRTASLAVTVLADGVDEPAESFTVRITGVRRAVVRDGKATVTILPPASPAEPSP